MARKIRKKSYYTKGPHKHYFSLWFLNKLNTELPYDPAVSLLDIYSQELRTGIQTDICTQILIVALITIAKMWKQSKHPSSNGYINKM